MENRSRTGKIQRLNNDKNATRQAEVEELCSVLFAILKRVLEEESAHSEPVLELAEAA